MKRWAVLAVLAFSAPAFGSAIDWGDGSPQATSTAANIVVWGATSGPAPFSATVVDADAPPFAQPATVASHVYSTPGSYDLRCYSTGTGQWVTTVITVSGSGNDPPTAAFTWTSLGFSISVDGSGSSDSDGTIASYDWDWGDNSGHGSGVVAGHSYTQAGSYNVTLTVTDNDGASGQITHQVVVGVDVTMESMLQQLEDILAELQLHRSTWTPLFQTIADRVVAIDGRLESISQVLTAIDTRLGTAVTSLAGIKADTAAAASSLAAIQTSTATTASNTASLIGFVEWRDDTYTRLGTMKDTLTAIAASLAGDGGTAPPAPDTPSVSPVPPSPGEGTYTPEPGTEPDLDTANILPLDVVTSAPVWDVSIAEPTGAPVWDIDVDFSGVGGVLGLSGLGSMHLPVNFTWYQDSGLRTLIRVLAIGFCGLWSAWRLFEEVRVH